MRASHLLYPLATHEFPPSLVGFAAAFIALSAATTAHAQVSHPYVGMTLVERPGPVALVALDLCAAGADVRVTRYAERRATPEAWAAPLGIRAAINGDFFDFPGWTYVVGRALGASQEWPAGDQNREPGRPYWQFGPGGARLIAAGSIAPEAGTTEILGGHNIIISGGRSTGPWSAAEDGALLNEVVRRTAVGLSADRRHLYMFASNAAMSAATVVATLQAMVAEGGLPAVEEATNQDGGGSSQLYLEGRGQIVDSGRQVNDHLGFFARGTGTAPFCPNDPPVGHLDGAACDFIHGWAQDPDAPSTSINVELYVGGPAGAAGAVAFPVHANESRADLCTALRSCDHAFALPTPYSFFDDVARRVYGYGVDTARGANGLLIGSPRTLQCARATPAFPATTGVRRHITSPAVLAAWHFTRYDIAPLTDAVLDAYPDGPDLAPAPVLASATTLGIDLLEYQTLRHVTNPTSLADWRFPAATVHPTAAQLALLLTGDALSTRPFLAQGSGSAVYLIDAPPPLWAVPVGNDAPPSLAYNETRAVTYTFRNRGASTWRPGEVWLAPTMPRDHASALCDPTRWSPGCTRAATVAAPVAPGQMGAFVVSLRAPGSGPTGRVSECWGLAAPNGHWFSDRGQNGPADDALCQTFALTETPVASDAGLDGDDVDGSGHGVPRDGDVDGGGPAAGTPGCGCAVPAHARDVPRGGLLALGAAALAARLRRARRDA